jgi:hypothetical protein
MSIKNVLILFFPALFILVMLAWGGLFFSEGNSVGMLIIGFTCLLNGYYWMYRASTYKEKNDIFQLQSGTQSILIGVKNSFIQNPLSSLEKDPCKKSERAINTGRATWLVKYFNFACYLTFYVVQQSESGMRVISYMPKLTFKDLKKIQAEANQKNIEVKLIYPKFRLFLREYGGVCLMIGSVAVIYGLMVGAMFMPWLFRPLWPSILFS